jgi:hypothetical protein
VIGSGGASLLHLTVFGPNDSGSSWSCDDVMLSERRWMLDGLDERVEEEESV